MSTADATGISNRSHLSTVRTARPRSRSIDRASLVWVVVVSAVVVSARFERFERFEKNIQAFSIQMPT